ncbi:MAG: HEAT repeat domain-containing protein [Deltaproteobacteria bacterium]|nr:HEAT repeat domain-containing protein [Deltaproteobacteria bacterium]
MRGVRVLSTAESVRTVAALVHHPSPDVRTQALSTLEYTRALAAEAGAEIAAALSDERDVVRLAAARVLRWLTPEGAEGVRASADSRTTDALRRSLTDPLYSVRWAAVRLLAAAKAASPEELTTVLLASEPTPGRFADDWALAADAIEPKPARLQTRLAEMRALDTAK